MLITDKSETVHQNTEMVNALLVNPDCPFPPSTTITVKAYPRDHHWWEQDYRTAVAFLTFSCQSAGGDSGAATPSRSSIGEIGDSDMPKFGGKEFASISISAETSWDQASDATSAAEKLVGLLENESRNEVLKSDIEALLRLDRERLAKLGMLKMKKKVVDRRFEKETKELEKEIEVHSNILTIRLGGHDDFAETLRRKTERDLAEEMERSRWPGVEVEVEQRDSKKRVFETIVCQNEGGISAKRSRGNQVPSD
ncbi:hypothetical protein K402DRAFT_460141 [Aulographum hederae CBS 113979]|uniref:Uncharacterized protein n=1 Tax=Aulographum hederae CBS 113979 TaxID=1176131 RepID=A0A6G1HBW7_9PEZI|nr:hypothetical protein K402DRAFT_460141 [Aulographum hederae CBS 113979]